MSTTQIDTVRGAAVTLGPAARANSTGLVMSEGLDFDEWADVGERLGRLAGSSAWWIGDWVDYGFWEYGKKYEEALARTGLAAQTLMNLASVARKFEISRRREKLSFGHHEAVAALEMLEQEMYLNRAEQQGLSVSALRDAVQANRHLPPGGVHVMPVRITISQVAPDRAERWRTAAEASGRDFAEWAADALDQAAA